MKAFAKLNTASFDIAFSCRDEGYSILFYTMCANSETNERRKFVIFFESDLLKLF